MLDVTVLRAVFGGAAGRTVDGFEVAYLTEDGDQHAELVSDPIAVLPVLFHLLWRHELAADLSVPLHPGHPGARGRGGGVMAAGRAVLRPGDRVHFDGAEHQVLGLLGVSVRLCGEAGVEQVVLAGYLMAAPDFHLGGPVLQLLPHHRYVCTRHWVWIGPPDLLDLSSPSLDELPEIVAAQRAHLRLLHRLGPAAPTTRY